MKAKLKRAVLIVLAAWDGMPMPEKSLVSAAQSNVRPASPTEGDVGEAIRDCEAEGYIQGATDDFSQERTWTLTDKGVHQARKVR